MSRYDETWLRSLLGKKGYSVPADAVATGICHPQPKQDAVLPPLGKDKDEKGSTGRFRVRIERRGARLLDADNAAGSVKFILDAIRYAGLVPDDSPAAIELEVTQACAPKKERGTLIIIERISP